MLQYLRKPLGLLGVWAAAVGVVLTVPTLVHAQDIVLGQIGPFTVLPVPDAQNLSMGIKAYIAQANKAGGIRGRKLSVFELDDTYSGDGFVARFAEAMERKPVALISPVGSAAISRMLSDKLLDKYDVVVMNGVPGAEALRNPGHPRFFHVRAGDKQQLEKIVNHARTLGILKLGVLHQNIAIGTSGMKVVADEAARLTGMEVKGFQSTTDPVEMAKAAQEVFKLNAQGVLAIGSPPFAAAAVSQLRKAGVTQSIFVLGDTPAGLLVKVAGVGQARGVGISQVYPNPNGQTKPLIREFQAAMKAAYPDLKTYSTFQLEGYLSARIVGEGLRRAKDFTPAALAKTLQTMGEIDFDGYRIDFSKSNVGSHFVDIGVVDFEGRLRY